METVFDAPEWFEALSLAERAALARDGEPPGATAGPERRERAARKVARWRSETDLTDDALFADRLAVDGLTPERLAGLLAEPAAGWQRRAAGRPPWLEFLARAFSRPAPALPAAVATAAGDLGALELVRPVVAAAGDGLLAALAGLRDGPPGSLPGGLPEGDLPGSHAAWLDAEAVVASLVPTLLRRLRWTCERTLALELHACRLEGKLAGETSEERFASFVALLRQPAAALEILRRYPVMARDVCRHAEQWAESSLETARRLAADRQDLFRLLAGSQDPGPWVGARTGLSDRHDGGRSVAVLSFGGGLRMVYKPKPLAVDLGFQELIGWLGERGLEPRLRRLAVLDRGTYGWVEHIEAEPCLSGAEAERFHQRLGAWVAIFFALEANDFHHENMIACGEHPVPIDLETVFQPAVKLPAAGGPGYMPTEHTVLNSGLLPRRFWATREEAGLDLSGMGGHGGQTIPVRRITGEGTDEMRWDLAEHEVPPGPNLPVLDGKPIAPWDRVEAVVAGFRAAYRLLWRHRGELLAPAGPLRRFAGLPIRALVRSTSVYAYLLHAGNHPDYLQSAVDRDRLYDRLWLDAVIYPPLRRAVPDEHADLVAGDVPLWRTTAEATDLVHSKGHRIAGYYAAPGTARVAARLRAMSEDDLERQTWLVKAAIEATRSLDDLWVWPQGQLPEAAGPLRPADFLAAACRIGDRLAQLAIVQGDFVTWFHLGLRPDSWLLEPLPIDLYSGLCGIALFLGHLGRLTGEERYDRLARLALQSARRRYEAHPAAMVHSGAFNGWGGLVYTLTHLGRLWQEPQLLAAAETLALAAMPGIEVDQTLDVIAGAAGAAASLLALYRHQPSPALLAAACSCGDRLLVRALEDARGLSWAGGDAVGGAHLTGFSHGAAGIAWALSWLAAVSGEERFRAAARGALRYERSWFSPEHDNWPDLRDSHKNTDKEYLLAWCHGAPGIGLARIGMLPHLEDGEIAAEIHAAVRTTLAGGFGGSQSLCHGDFGNLELVREAGRALGDAALTAESERLAARILTRIESGGLRCGANPKTESLGLMVGLAGIGYGMLRAACPAGVPGVLLLETP